jgi:hypothetical protein
MIVSAFAIRAGLGLAFFVILGLWDIVRHPDNPRRAKEYTFLFALTGAAMIYAVAHDFVTYHISPEYFIYGKGLANARAGFGWPVVKLALMAGWSPGLIAGAALLTANNRDKLGRQLPYPALWRYAVLVLLASAGMAVALGSIISLFPSRVAAAIDLPHSGDSARAFITVWGIHIGTYAGALIGVIGATIGVIRGKRRIDIL